MRITYIVRLNYRNNAFRIDWYMRCAYPVLRRHDEIGFSARGQVCHRDIVQTFKAWCSRVDLDDDLICHLNDFRRRTNAGSGNDSTIFGNGRSLNDCNVQSVVLLVLRVKAIH